MNVLRRKRALWETASTCVLLFAAVSIFLRPGVAAQGVVRGLRLCYESVIPALFPFLVISKLLLEGPLAAPLGLVLRPYTRALSIGSSKAPAALLCGILGGFASGAKAVDLLYRRGELSAQEASLLLVCSIGSGPGFVVGSVGALMLGSAGAGWLLLSAQLGASLVCGTAAALFFRLRKARAAYAACATGPLETVLPQSAMHKPHSTAARAQRTGFVAAVQDGVNATVMLCGYVTLFSFLAAVSCPTGADGVWRFAAALPLEVTAACRAACEGGLPMRTQFCCAALSIMGASVFLQVRALVSPRVALGPLFASRLLHLPLALAFLALGLRLFPQAASAGASLDGPLLATRMPPDAMLAVFALAALASGAVSSARRCLPAKKMIK